ncbi:MAG: 4-(cytidine 5'-diphospho)-2-C-methyl-D-erythritol kinase [Alistipes sp.]|nr:4-(cytidine 5'-diphospho)-2-C-methyl-D-erythritol kinase [Alistipes sp.]
MEIKANCKINLGLDVLRRREDGYHDLSTIMLPVEGLYDIVSIERREDNNVEFKGIGLQVDCPPESNICVKAARLMQERYGIAGIDITLDKRVPFGAGLGGGSADGTAVIVGINQIYGLSLAEEELISLAAELGSDTAFFVRNTPQLCEGRGEIMTPVEVDLRGLWLVVVKPDESVSTREAYAGITPAMPDTPLTERIKRPIGEWQQIIKNDFEKSVFASHPAIAEAKQQLIDMGATYASMSGSGSALFALFDDEAKAEKMRQYTDYIFAL